MNVRVYYHAFLREKLGRESELLAVSAENAERAAAARERASTASDVVSAFVAAHPEFARLAPALNVAVNDEIVGRGAAVTEDARVDLLPPYGGG